MMGKLFIILILTLFCAATCKAENYDDFRCRCVCPYPSVVNVTTKAYRHVYIDNVPPKKCNCDEVVLPQLGNDLNGKEKEFCPRCECSYETRNTTIIKVVVIIVIWVISLLCIYMLFLMCLDPLLNKRVKGNYQEHTNEEDEAGPSTAPSDAVVRSNVLNRVGNQQEKWKRQVREQRKNIYDKHTMLN